MPFFESSRRRPRQEKSTFRVLKSQTTNWGSCSYFLFWKRERSPPLPRQFSVEGETSNALTREFNQLDERTHSSTTKRESALGSPLESPTTNEQIQARDTSEESSELRQQLNLRLLREHRETLALEKWVSRAPSDLPFIIYLG